MNAPAKHDERAIARRYAAVFAELEALKELEAVIGRQSSVETPNGDVDFSAPSRARRRVSELGSAMLHVSIAMGSRGRA